MGELSISTRSNRFEIRHHADCAMSELEIFRHPEDARKIARFDAAGKFRPLKSAPNLRRGWLLKLKGMADLRLALDFFYPAMLGAWVASQHGSLRPVPFRETANRQSGMYAVVKKISAADADALIGNFCPSDGKCLKTILWKIDNATAITSLPPSKFDLTIEQLTETRAAGVRHPIPLPCAEACHLLIAAARNVVKGSAP